MMLSSAFFDWWFAPWAYAMAGPAGMPAATDRMRLRDGYRLWCAAADIPADLPEDFDPEWQSAGVLSEKELRAAARLFAGLIAAREHQQKMLGALPSAERKWCASVASTQPLRGIAMAVPEKEAGVRAGVEARGIAELAIRVDSDFRGMWPRLRLMLSASLASEVQDILAATGPAPRQTPAATLRAQRCWALCRQRAAATEHA